MKIKPWPKVRMILVLTIIFLLLASFKATADEVKYIYDDLGRLYKVIDGKINLSKTAELLSLTRLELEKEFKVKGIPIRHLSKEDVVAEVEAIKEW